MIVIFATVLEVPNRSSYNSWKLRVHRNERVIVYYVSYQVELVFEILLPYFSDP